MPTRTTVVGLIVLGIVLAGVFWARGRNHPAGPMPGGSGSGQLAAGQVMADTEIPDVTSIDGTVDVGDVRIVLSVSPRPPVAFEKKQFRVRAEAKGAPVTLTNGHIAFEMKMPMGDHRYSLVAANDGWHEAEVVLPFCPSGNPRWYAVVEGSVDGRAVAARFRVDLTRPGP